MKKCKFFLAVFTAVVLLLAGCTNAKNMSTMEKIQEQLSKIDNYRCTATVTIVSNKGRNDYGTKQFYKKTGEYRLEMVAPETVKGVVTVFDGTNVMQYNPRVESKRVYPIAASKDRDEIFLGTFLKNYIQSEEVSIAVVKTEEGKSTVLEAVVPGNHPYLSTEKLWVDNKNLKPTQLAIYDPQGNERIVVKYQDFEYNVSLDDTLFRLEAK